MRLNLQATRCHSRPRRRRDGRLLPSRATRRLRRHRPLRPPRRVGERSDTAPHPRASSRTLWSASHTKVLRVASLVAPFGRSGFWLLVIGEKQEPGRAAGTGTCRRASGHSSRRKERRIEGVRGMCSRRYHPGATRKPRKWANRRSACSWEVFIPATAHVFGKFAVPASRREKDVRSRSVRDVKTNEGEI